MDKFLYTYIHIYTHTYAPSHIRTLTHTHTHTHTHTALAIMDGKADPNAKKEKQAASCRVAIRQLSIVERILLTAYAEGDPLASATIVGCIFCPPGPNEDPVNSSSIESFDEKGEPISMGTNGTSTRNSSNNNNNNNTNAMANLAHPTGNGIMSCLEHLTGAGVYLDPMESLKVQVSSSILDILDILDLRGLRGLRVYYSLYISIMLASCFMWSGALDSSGVFNHTL